MRLQVLLLQARQQLVDKLALAASEARIEAQILLRHALGGVSRAWLIAHEEQTLTLEQQTLFDHLLQRRLQGEPIAYILGQREFYGLEFGVTPDVLIPRPDTETLVEAALELIPENLPSPQPSPACGRGGVRVLDLGTGSGAIAIAIAKQRPNANVTAVDVSKTALEVARRNAQRLGAENVRFLLSDWFLELDGETFDIIVGNPPYIVVDDPHLGQGDLRFEPASALASGADGLNDIRSIVAQAPQHLAPGGWLLLEHGYDQAEQVAELLKGAGFKQISHGADLAGILRVTVGKAISQTKT